MGTLSARSLTQALSQARNIGLVEEPFVLGDISLVVRNLRPDQYDAVFKECQGLSDVEYINTWQMAHVARAVCELNGVDLREAQFIEDEEPDPKRPGQNKTVKLEVHNWLRKNLLSTWSREAIFICYRKVSDAIEAAEKKAQEGITFRIPDEDAEERARRLIGEFKEIEDAVPPRILDALLADNGLVRRSTQEELDAANSKLAEVTPAEDAPTEDSSVPAPEPEPTPDPVVEQRKTAGPPTPERMAQLLRNRVPMNQQPEMVDSAGAAPSPQETFQPTGVHTPPTQPPIPTHAVAQSALSGRAAEMAALESLPGMADPLPTTAVNLQPQDTIPEVRLGSSPKLDPAGIQTILDAPPVGGINPRYRPPTR